MKKRTVYERHQRLSLILGFAVFAAAWLVSMPSLAQDYPVDTGFPIQLLKPSPGPYNFISVESPEIGDDMKPFVGLMGGYQHRPFVLFSCDENNNCDDNGNTIDAVKSLVFWDLMGSFNFLKYFQAGLVMPMSYQAGTSFIVPPQRDSIEGAQDYKQFVLGDMRIHLKARFIGKDGEDGISLAVAVIPTLPLAEWIGANDAGGDPLQASSVDEGGAGYGGSSSVSVTVPKIMFGYRFHNLRTAVSAGFLFQKKAEILSTEIGNTFNFSGAVGYAIIPEIEIIAELYGNKSMVSEKVTDSESSSLLFLGGGKFRVKDFIFNIGGGGGVLSGVGVPQFQIVGGAAWAPMAKQPTQDDLTSEWDHDGDGIDNEADECPDQAEDHDGFQDEDGCPDDDNDNDGVIDGYDSCPMEAEDKDNYRDDDGCPDLDHDEDGIKEADDKCPDNAEDFDGFEDEDGCPEIDNDKDGIDDEKDLCKNDAEDKDDFEDEDGCPEYDNDGDGVPDEKDKCPDEAETLNGHKDEDGCPDRGKALVIVTEERIEIREKVQFKTSSDEIRGSKSFEILDIVAAILNGNKLTRITIEGHTDNKGNEAANIDLSKRRAEAVKKYLVKQGIEDTRLETAGLGPKQPIDSNKTREGRAANRRVEFVIIQTHKKVAKTDDGDAGDDGAMDFTGSDEDDGAMDFTGGDDEGDDEGDDDEMDFTAE